MVYETYFPAINSSAQATAIAWRRRLARNQIIVVDSGVLISGEGLWWRGSALIAWKIRFSRMAGLSAK
jgi:hypothetical protein